MATGCAAARPLFSIVMPAYQAAPCLGVAVDAIRAQTLDDWELIIVDDGSTDGTDELARELAATDARIRVISHEHNQGLSASRETGLAEARGSYVLMLDSDDEAAPDLLSRVAASAAQVPGGADVVMFGFVERYLAADGTFLYDHALPLAGAAYPSSDAWHGLVAGLERSTHLGYCWNKAYRLELVRNLRFERVRLIEDVLFNAEVLARATSLAFVDGAPYTYVKREGMSLTNANDYSASEYWGLHVRRVQVLRDLLGRWGVLDVEARSVLGSLYARFLLSALMRSYDEPDRWGTAARRRWWREVSASPLFRELVPPARQQGSRSLAVVLTLLKARCGVGLRAVARATHLARSKAYPLFTKLRSGR